MLPSGVRLDAQDAQRAEVICDLRGLRALGDPADVADLGRVPAFGPEAGLGGNAAKCLV